MVSVDDPTIVREHPRIEALLSRRLMSLFRLHLRRFPLRYSCPAQTLVFAAPFSSWASRYRTDLELMASDGAVPVAIFVASKPSLELDQLVDAITIELAAQKSEGRRDIERVRAIMAAWDASDRKTWADFAQFDPDKAYTRNLIATDNQNFTLMMLCWNKGRLSPVHDHADSECWVRVVSGTAREELFETDPDPDKPLRLKKTASYEPGAVTHIHDAMGIHRLGNADSESELVTLHCYAPPFKSCHIFPDQLSHGVECTMTFYSEHGKKHTDDDAMKSDQANPCFCP